MSEEHGTQSIPEDFHTAVAAMLTRVQSSLVQVRGKTRHIFPGVAWRPPGSGSGVIWSADGHIVTNAHVIAFAIPPIQVILDDGRTLDVRVVECNPLLDLALLKIEMEDTSDLPVVESGDSTALRVGELVFAVGNPWGIKGIVTTGIVSGFGTMKAGFAANPALHPLRCAAGTGQLRRPDGQRSRRGRWHQCDDPGRRHGCGYPCTGGAKLGE